MDDVAGSSVNIERKSYVEQQPNNRRAGRYLAIGIGAGLAVGAGTGVAIDNIAVGVGMGIAIGVALGLVLSRRYKDKSGGQ